MVMLAWFAMGVNAAYGLSLITALVVLNRGGDPMAMREDLMSVVPLGTLATLSWFVGYMVVGPWWAVLTAPALVAAVLLCLAVCAYVREQRANKKGDVA